MDKFNHIKYGKKNITQENPLRKYSSLKNLAGKIARKQIFQNKKPSNTTTHQKIHTEKIPSDLKKILRQISHSGKNVQPSKSYTE